jgi:hypothetical protein
MPYLGKDMLLDINNCNMLDEHNASPEMDGSSSYQAREWKK